MSLRKKTGSAPCIYCGKLVAVGDDRCWNCGGKRPALLGFSPLLRRLGPDMGFSPFVIVVCGLLYLFSLLLSALAGFEQAPGGSFLRILSPNTQVLFVFGATGSIPVFEYGRWWTVLSSAWLHGGLLHIVFNMLWIRMLAPAVGQLFGPGRLIIIYTTAAIAGGAATTLASGYFPELPGPLRGASLSIGASGAVFGLLGAIVRYGKRGGAAAAGQQAWTLAAVLFVFGFLMPGVDNWGHLGGFLGGYGAAWVLDPRRRERAAHVVAGLFCLVLSAASVLASIIDTVALALVG
ncbi:MAG: rhomboid family intramembrane serine protease [Myxococcota bacterium]